MHTLLPLHSPSTRHLTHFPVDTLHTFLFPLVHSSSEEQPPGTIDNAHTPSALHPMLPLQLSSLQQPFLRFSVICSLPA